MNMAETLKHLCRHWESRRTAGANHGERDKALPPFTIALAREAGTNGTSIAREIGERLGWLVYDHELVERIAQEMGIRASLLKSVDERRMNWIAQAFEASMPSHGNGGWNSSVSESAYSHHLIKTVLALGVHGECVILGRGAAFILPASTTLRVRLMGQPQERIAVLAHRMGISDEEAAGQLRNLDSERADFVQDHFFKDTTDPHNFDLVLNTPRFTVAQAADLIVEALHRLQASAREKNAEVSASA